jgi:hypothetical protein
MATLPRLRPRKFYDLVVEVALIRPGPIQGGSVHPYIRRRNGQEPVTYLHPLLEKALGKTLGVPIFQEQMMQMAIDVAGFTGAEADQLRQAMGSKRSHQRMAQLRARFYDGMAERGITGAVADEIYDKVAAFANFGFPESHSVSFAYLVYASSWIKLHYPAAFCAALLNAQPMGFWSPATIVADARRHGVLVRGPDVNASSDVATLEPLAPLAPKAELAGQKEWPPVRWRCGWGCRTCARWVPRWRPPFRPAGRMPTWRTWCAGPASPNPRSRRWPPPAPSPASRRLLPPSSPTGHCIGGRRCGQRARWPRLVPTVCPAWWSVLTRPACPS